MSDEFYISHRDVAKLGKSFATYAYDLEQYAKAFEQATSAEAIGDGLGGEVGSVYAELAEHAASALGELHRRLDAIGGKLVTGAEQSEASDDALGQLFRDATD